MLQEDASERTAILLHTELGELLLSDHSRVVVHRCVCTLAPITQIVFLFFLCLRLLASELAQLVQALGLRTWTSSPETHTVECKESLLMVVL